MRHGQALLLVLILWLVGCAGSPSRRSTSLLERLRQIGGGPTGPDVVQLDVALLEQPLGDRYLSEQVWETADEQVVALERRAQLEENGFRVGQIGGILPPPLQGLLLSERSCINPRRIRLHAGRPATLVLGPTQPRCQFQVSCGGERRDVDLDQAQCLLEVVPQLAPDGRVGLHCTPVVRHGTATLVPRPTPDRSAWLLEEQRPSERFADLSWEVTLTLNEYAVIGPRLEKRGSLGYVSFTGLAAPSPLQRVLVIRTTRLAPEPIDEPGETPPSPSPLSSPPLALQAVCTLARGTSR
ncbi:MAG: hypothetical protein NZ700_02660 [Gemmataceae bacterium]|nr:hypothetical protein [Gemmataceae bacterium]MDW8264138.1 hypothetical protein [Gemmataceae bacterium]